MTALGLALLLVGAIVIAVEVHVPSMGALGGPGVIAIGAGSVLAVSGLGGGLALAVVVALVIVAAAGTALMLSIKQGLAAKRGVVTGGREGLIGHLGTVRSWEEPTGKVLVDGALWRAQHSWGEDGDALHSGDRVVVERLTGLTLGVRRAEDWELSR
jgi:membrane-bound serine protease (ClpP class)